MSSRSLCSSTITAVPPLLRPPQTWSFLSRPRTPPPTSNGSTRRPSAPWKLQNRHSASAPPPPPLCQLAADSRKWPRTTPCPPAPTSTRGRRAAEPQPPRLVSSAGCCPLRSARRVWKDSCRRRRASSLRGRWETEAGTPLPEDTKGLKTHVTKSSTSF